MELDSKIHGETTQLLWHLSGKSVPYKYCPILAYLYNPRSSFCPIDRIHKPHKDKPTYCAMKWLQPFSLFVGIFWSYLSHLCSANLEVIWLFPMESKSRHIRTKRNKRTMRTMRVVRAKLSMATPGVRGRPRPVAGSIGMETDPR